MDEKRFSELFPEPEEKEKEKSESFFRHMKQQIKPEKCWQAEKETAVISMKKYRKRKMTVIYGATVAACLVVAVVLPNLSKFLKMSEVSTEDTVDNPLNETAKMENSEEDFDEDGQEAEIKEETANPQLEEDEKNQDGAQRDGNQSQEAEEEKGENEKERISSDGIISDNSDSNQENQNQSENQQREEGDDTKQQNMEERADDSTEKREEKAGHDTKGQNADEKTESDTKDRKNTSSTENAKDREDTDDSDDIGEAVPVEDMVLDSVLDSDMGTASSADEAADTTATGTTTTENTVSYDIVDDIADDTEDDDMEDDIADTQENLNRQDLVLKAALIQWYLDEMRSPGQSSENTTGDDASKEESCDTAAAETTTETTDTAEVSQEDVEDVLNGVTLEDIRTKLKQYAYLYAQNAEGQDCWYQACDEVIADKGDMVLKGGVLLFQKPSGVLDEGNPQQYLAYAYEDEDDLSKLYVRYSVNGESRYYCYKKM